MYHYALQIYFNWKFFIFLSPFLVYFLYQARVFWKYRKFGATRVSQPLTLSNGFIGPLLKGREDTGILKQQYPKAWFFTYFSPLKLRLFSILWLSVPFLIIVLTFIQISS